MMDLMFHMLAPWYISSSDIIHLVATMSLLDCANHSGHLTLSLSFLQV